MRMKVPMAALGAQYAGIRDEIDAGVQAVLESGRFVHGPQVAAFEREAAAFLGAAHAVTCASGTDALHLGLAALGIGAGDEVITSAFTFAATAEAIRCCGAEPVFIDIDPRTFNLDANAIEAAVGPRTRAILPVHVFGQPAAMEPIAAIAERHGLALIEDCAQSFGATRGGRATGTLGAAGCFSFFPSKNLGACGDGGMVTTSSPDLAASLRELCNHGSTAPGCHRVVGYNSRLDEIQAVILRTKLRRIKRYNHARRSVARRYTEAFADLPGLVTPVEDPGGLHVYHQYTVLTRDRDAVARRLSEQGIDTAVYYRHPLHRQPAFASGDAPPSLPMTELAAAHCLSLPIYPELSEGEVAGVIEAVRDAAKGIEEAVAPAS